MVVVLFIQIIKLRKNSQGKVSRNEKRTKGVPPVEEVWLDRQGMGGGKGDIRGIKKERGKEEKKKHWARLYYKRQSSPHCAKYARRAENTIRAEALVPRGNSLSQTSSGFELFGRYGTAPHGHRGTLGIPKEHDSYPPQHHRRDSFVCPRVQGKTAFPVWRRSRCEAGEEGSWLPYWCGEGVQDSVVSLE